MGEGSVDTNEVNGLRHNVNKNNYIYFQNV